MQRTAGVAALVRQAAAASSAVQAATSPLYCSHHCLSQAASFTGLSSSGVESRSQGRVFEYLSSPPTQCIRHGVAGTVLFSAAASSTVQDAYAKEPAASSSPFHSKNVVLYQYEACPFCNKVKAFLDYYDIPYKVVEVNPINKKEIKWSDYKKVPILKVDEEQMVNSSDIINDLYKRIHSDGSADSIEGSDEEKEWLGWVDNHLVHVLSPNIYRSVGEALESFDYITTHGNFSFMERIIAKYSGAAAMYFVSKKLKKRHNITDERGALYQSAETWVDALKGRDFLGGRKPNLADLSVFGVLRPIRNLQSGKDMVEHTRIGEWYSRMEKAVGQPSRIHA